MKLHLQPTRVATGSDDAEGQLVFADGLLVAVLVQLSEQHEGEAGMWFLEAGFGPAHHINPPTFLTLHEAQHWIVFQIAGTLDSITGGQARPRGLL